MNTIKFGTDGWRAIIADDYTVANVARVAEATAKWLLKNYSSHTVVVGYDCRFGGKMFSETVACVLASNNIKVLLSTGISSTPMVALGVVKNKAQLGIVITASHNPPDYNGFKLKGEYGGPLLEIKVKEIEKIIPSVDFKAPTPKPPIGGWGQGLKDFMDKGLVKYTDIETMYIKQVEKSFDLKKIRNSGIGIAYDAMYGAGQNVIRRILPEATLLHCVHNPSFGGTAPEPIERNLVEFRNIIKKSGKIDVGLSTDGDADRIGLFDGKGQFVDSHKIILLLIHYLVHYKKMGGKVCVAFSVTEKVKKMCAHYNLPFHVVKVGFKYVCDVMLHEDTLLGGEESGGIAIKGHIPERDGIWIGLAIMEFMAKTGKTLDELMKEVTKITGKFSYKRNDLHLTEEIKQTVLEKCRQNKFSSFGKFKVKKVETIDGFKFFFDEEEWLMIRASGTEPVLRLYAEASSSKKVDEILEEAQKVVMNK